MPFYTNKLIEKYTSGLEKFNMNVLIAYLHETYNFLSKEIENLDINQPNVISKLHTNFLHKTQNIIQQNVGWYLLL